MIWLFVVLSILSLGLNALTFYVSLGAYGQAVTIFNKLSVIDNIRFMESEEIRDAMAQADDMESTELH